MSSAARHLRPWAGFLLVLMLLALVPVARVGIEAHRAYDLALAAESVGDVPSAIVHHRHVLQWYLPIGTPATASLARLVALGDAAVEAGDLQLALFAWRSARTAILLTRHLWVPHADQLDPLHVRISSAMAQQTGVPADAVRFRLQLENWRQGRPHPAWVMASGLAFVGWLVSLGITLWRSIDRRGTVARGTLLRGMVVTAGVFAVWIVLVRFA